MENHECLIVLCQIFATTFSKSLPIYNSVKESISCWICKKIETQFHIWCKYLKRRKYPWFSANAINTHPDHTQLMLVCSGMQIQSFLSPFDWPFNAPSNQLFANSITTKRANNWQIIIVTSSALTLVKIIIEMKDNDNYELSSRSTFSIPIAPKLPSKVNDAFVIGNDLNWKRLVT